MTYTPIGILGSSPANVAFTFSSTFILENTPSLVETILNCDVIYSIPSMSNYINSNFTGSSVIFSGNVPLDVFDQYQLTYVDKGESDKTQTPVTTTIGNMPDHKELYKIQPDSRVSIEIQITMNIKIQKKTIGIPPAEDTIEIINEVINYTLEIMNDLNYITNWTKDYFANRY